MISECDESRGIEAMCANGREFARISTHPLVLLGFELWLGGDCVLYLTLLGYLPGVIFAAVVICCKDPASVRQHKNNYATCGGTAQTPLDLVRKTARLTTGGGSFGNLMKSGLWKKVDKVSLFMMVLYHKAGAFRARVLAVALFCAQLGIVQRRW